MGASLPRRSKMALDLGLGSVSVEVKLDTSAIKRDLEAAFRSANTDISLDGLTGLTAGFKKLSIEVKQFEGNLTNIGSSGKASFAVLSASQGDAIAFYKQLNLSIAASGTAFKEAGKAGATFLKSLGDDAKDAAKSLGAIGTSAASLASHFATLDDPLKSAVTALKSLAKLSLGDLAKEVGKIASAAKTVETAWERTQKAFVSTTGTMEAHARSTGAVLVENLNHNAADTVAAAWRRTAGVFDAMTDRMVSDARSTGAAIVNGFDNAFDKIKGMMKTPLGEMSFGGFNIASMGIDAVKNAIGALKDFTIQAYQQMGAALVGFTGKALDTAASISKSLNVVKSLTGDQNTSGLQSAIVSAGVASTQTTASIASYTEQLARSGMNQKDIAASLKPIALLADASGEDIGKTGKAVIAAGNAYQLGSDKIDKVATTLLAAATSSQGASTAGFDKFNQYFKVQSASGEEGLKRSAQIYTLLKAAGAENAAAGRNIATFYKALANPSNANKNSQSEINSTLKGAGKDGTVSGFNNDGSQRSEVDSLLSAVKAYRQLKTEVGDQKAMKLFGDSMGVEAMRQIVALSKQSEEQIAKSLDTINRKIANSGLVDAFYAQATSGLAGARKLLEGSIDGFTAAYGLSLEGAAGTVTGVFAVAMGQIASDEKLFAPLQKMSDSFTEFSKSADFKVLGDGLAGIGKNLISMGIEGFVNILNDLKEEFKDVGESVDVLGILLQIPVRGFLLISGGIKNLIILTSQVTKAFRNVFSGEMFGGGENPITAMLGPDMQAGIEGFKSGFSSIGAAIGDAFKLLAPALISGIGSAFKIIGEVVGAIAPIISTVIRYFAAIASIGFYQTASGLKILANVLSPILSVAKVVFTALEQIGRVAFTAFTAGVQNAFAGFFQLGNAIERAIGAPMRSMASTATQGIINFANGFRTLAITIGRIGGTIASFFIKPDQAIIGMGRGLSMIMARFGDMGKAAGTMVQVITSMIAPVFASIRLPALGTIADVFNIPLTSMGAAWQGFTAALQSGWNAAIGAIQAAWDTYVALVKDAIALLQSGWQAFTAALQSGWDAAIGAIQATWDALVALIQSAIANIQTTWNAMATAFGQAFQAVVTAVQDAMSSLTNAIANVASRVSDGIGGAASGLLRTFNSVRSAIEGWMSPINKAIEGLGKASSAMGDYARQAANSVGSAAQSAFNPIAQVFGFASGGVLPGYSRTDDQLIMARSGEGIIVPEAVALLGGASGIDRLNRSAERGTLQGFANGGIVGSAPSGDFSKILSAMGAITKSFPEIQKVIVALGSSVTPDLLNKLGLAIGKLSTSAKASLSNVVNTALQSGGDGISGVARSLGSSVSDAMKPVIIAQQAMAAGLTKAQTAYVLATAQHESDQFRTMTEYASGAAYEGRSDLGNTQAGDGERYRGRGFVQLTGRANYAEQGRQLGIDLINRPELAEIPEIAAKILINGMKTGAFTGAKLSDFASGDFEGMRAIVNGSDKAGLIASYAQKYASVLDGLGTAVNAKTLESLQMVAAASKGMVNSAVQTMGNPLQAALAKIPAIYRSAIESVLNGTSKSLPGELAGYLSQLSPSLTGGALGGGGSAMGAKLLATAKSWVGREFNPGVFAQCAAFVRDVFSKAGIGLSETLSRSADGQDYGVLEAGSLLKGSIGQVIKDKSQIMAGDIVMWSKTYGDYGNDVTHVGIATGNGMMIDRSTSSAPVRERPIDTFSNFVAAVRPDALKSVAANVPIDREKLKALLSSLGSKIGGMGITDLKAQKNTALDALKAAIDKLQSEKAAIVQTAQDDRYDARLKSELADMAALQAKIKAADLERNRRNELAVANARKAVENAKTAKGKATAQAALDELLKSQPIAVAKVTAAQQEQLRKAQEAIDRVKALIATEAAKNGIGVDIERLQALESLQKDYFDKRITEAQLQERLRSLGVTVESLGSALGGTTDQAKQTVALIPTMRSLMTIMNEGLLTAYESARKFGSFGNQIERQLQRGDLSDTQRLRALPIAYQQMLGSTLRPTANLPNLPQVPTINNIIDRLVQQPKQQADLNIRLDTRNIGGEQFVPLAQVQQAIQRTAKTVGGTDYRYSYSDRLNNGFG